MTIEDQVKSFKILLVGDSGTGKTSLLSRLIANKFDAKCEPTSGCCFETHDTLVDNQPIKADIWDLGGREKYRAMRNSLFHDAAGIFLVYDISKGASFKNITQWLKDIVQLAGPKTVVKLVGNKSDLEHRRAVPIEKVEQLAADIGLSFTETSALGSSNVNRTFQWMIEEICATMTSVSSNADHGRFSTCSSISNRMKEDIKLEHRFKDLSFDDTQHQEKQQQEEPFHIVLIDIKKAADYEIHCVKKPLEDDDLKYVALSYRWGELPETIIDTKEGYIASVKSFDLSHFYRLCYMMTREADFKKMDYVWVDAICVDQTNYERRKATIQKMSNIYDKATYILAVPDLHMKYLETTSTTNKEIMKGSLIYNHDLYYLIHGDTDQLARIEDKWLDKYKVPADPDLRQSLKTSTDHFMDGFMKLRKHHRYYNAEEVLDHLGETSSPAAATPINGHTNEDQVQMEDKTRVGGSAGMERMHNCHQVDCPLDLFQEQLPQWRENMIDKNGRYYNRTWQQCIYERSVRMRRSMKLMEDLVKDWSTRVWVISEYNIAKRKNNMKYWFLQLDPEFFYVDVGFDSGFTFFKFDFSTLPFAAYMDRYSDYNQVSTEPVYLAFHQTINTQLIEQTFFEMMLKSMASKDEDRFYAIFPLSEYKNTIGNKAEVESWKIDSLVSVKLKLYEVMNTKDKLSLLFFSGNRKAENLGHILPTFATSLLNWDNIPLECFMFKDQFNNVSCNFDLTNPSTITLCHQSSDKDDRPNLPYLNLKPREYFVNLRSCTSDFYSGTRHLWSRLQSEDPYYTNCLVRINCFTKTTVEPEVDDFRWNHYIIYLNGNFEKNVWMMQGFVYDSIHHPEYSSHWIRHTSDAHHAGFNIY